MKKIRLSVITALPACSFFAISYAEAKPGLPGGSVDVALPIDTHVWVLAIVATLTGTAVLVGRNKKASKLVLALQQVSK